MKLCPDRLTEVPLEKAGLQLKSTLEEIANAQGETRAGALKLRLPHHDVMVSVIAHNANGASEPSSIHVLWRGPKVEPKPKLYVLAIGITHYHNKDYDLHYAAKDAEDFVAAAKAQKGSIYEDVVTPAVGGGSLRDEAATLHGIRDQLDWIENAPASSDVAMVFISGHGMRTPNQHYHFLPYDYDPAHRNLTTIAEAELQQYLANIGGKKLLFIDTLFRSSGGLSA